MIVRPETSADHDAVRAVVHDAFGGDEVPVLLDAMRESVAWLDLAFVAEQDEAVIGHVSFVRAWLDTPSGPVVDVLTLSPLSVRRDRQGRGIGTTLAREALSRLADRSEPLVFLEGSPAYYRRLGFVAGAKLGFVKPSVHIPDTAFQVVAMASYEPWMTGALVYPDVFWRHDSVGLRA